MDFLHLLKLMIEMRNDNLNQKFTNWSVKYLFAHYLFGGSFQIMLSVELIFVSLLEVCNAFEDLGEDESARKEYQLKMMSLLRSVVDFYSVVFRNLKLGMSRYMNATKKFTPEAKKNYLKSLNLDRFLTESGQQSIAYTSSKKRAGDINLKFMKILLDRCTEFEEFIEFVYNKKEIDVLMGEPIFQLIRIIHTLKVEAEERRKKDEEEERENEAREKLDAERGNADGNVSGSEGASENLSRKQSEGGEGEIGTGLGPRTVSKTSKGRKMVAFDQRNKKPAENAFLFEDDDEDELEDRDQRHHGTHRQSIDDKTKHYLNEIKAYQDEDEYDDTHEMGDRRKQQQVDRSKKYNDNNKNNNSTRFTRKNKDNEEDEFDEEDFVDPRVERANREREKDRQREKEDGDADLEEADSDEEFDPMDMGEKKLSKMGERKDSYEEKMDTHYRKRDDGARGARGRGGMAGARKGAIQTESGNTRGGDRKGGRDDYRDKEKGGRDDYRTKERGGRDDYRDKERGGRDDYRDKERGGRDDYRPREREGREDYRDEKGGRDDYRPRERGGRDDDRGGRDDYRPRERGEKDDYWKKDRERGENTDGGRRDENRQDQRGGYVKKAYQDKDTRYFVYDVGLETTRRVMMIL